MGYESRIYVIDRKKSDDFVYGAEIARFDLSKIGYEVVAGKTFRDVFTAPIDFDIDNGADESGDYVPDDFRVDNYGEHCKYTDIQTVIDWLQSSETAKEYRRAALFLDFLRVLSARESEYRELVLVHFGY